jgi:dipeptidyl aminopeptidase/acylaminoacyl peptidase
MKVSSIAPFLLLFFALLAGCDDSTRPGDFPPIRLVAGADASDTVLSVLTQALIVEVNGEGGPMPGTVVRFQGVPTNPNDTWGTMTALISPPDRNAFGSFISDTTDENGRAFALVQLGTKAGIASIVVTVPDIGAEDTAHFTVMPGNPYSVVALPSDTSLYVGNSFTPRSTVTDRYQNPIDGDVAYSTVGEAVAFADGKAKAVHIGRSLLIAAFDSLKDTTTISVVPMMTFGAIRGQEVVMANADGSGYRVLAPAGSGSPYTTDWTPSGDGLVFDHGYGSGPIDIAELDGTVRTLNASDEWGLYPEVSPDGSWVYFSRGSYDWNLYRVHLDGTGEEAVPMNTPRSDVAPSLSPDGKRLVYVLTDPGRDHLMLLDLNSGETTDLNIFGHSPAWSPDGSQIAYLQSTDFTLHVVKPDGSDDRSIGAGNDRYDFGIDWSPDSKWVIARNSTRNYLELVEAASGLTFPLGFTAGYRGPSWKP